MKVIRHRSLFSCEDCGDEYLTLCVIQDREVCIKCYREITGNIRANIPRTRKRNSKPYDPQNWGEKKKQKRNQGIKRLSKLERRKQIRDDHRFLGRAKQQLSRKPTTYEVIASKKLDDAGIRYEFQSVFYINGFMGIADFFLIDYGIYLEIDGGYHTDPEQAIADAARDIVLEQKLQRRTLRMENCAVCKVKPFGLKYIIEKYTGKKE